jgi:hypothetical protein
VVKSGAEAIIDIINAQIHTKTDLFEKLMKELTMEQEQDIIICEAILAYVRWDFDRKTEMIRKLEKWKSLNRL